MIIKCNTSTRLCVRALAWLLGLRERVTSNNEQASNITYEYEYEY